MLLSGDIVSGIVCQNELPGGHHAIGLNHRLASFLHRVSMRCLRRYLKLASSYVAYIFVHAFKDWWLSSSSNSHVFRPYHQLMDPCIDPTCPDRGHATIVLEHWLLECSAITEARIDIFTSWSDTGCFMHIFAEDHHAGSANSVLRLTLACDLSNDDATCKS